MSIKKMGEGGTRGAYVVSSPGSPKAKSSGEDLRANGGLVSNLPHPRVNKTKQHTSSEHLRQLKTLHHLVTST